MRRKQLEDLHQMETNRAPISCPSGSHSIGDGKHFAHRPRSPPSWLSQPLLNQHCFLFQENPFFTSSGEQLELANKTNSLSIVILDIFQFRQVKFWSKKVVSNLWSFYTMHLSDVLRIYYVLRQYSKYRDYHSLFSLANYTFLGRGRQIHPCMHVTVRNSTGKTNTIGKC